MGGLTFDDDDDVDPTTPLGELFLEWCDILAARSSPATTSGYVSDARLFSEALCQQLGRQPAPEPAALPPGPVSVPAATRVAAWRTMSALTLLDLHPRNLARVVDRLGATRSAASQRRLAAAWSNLCTLLVRRGLLASNPMKHDAVVLPSRPHPSPAPIETAEADRMLATICSPDGQARQPWPARDFALAALLLAGGLRVGEACTVKVGDITTDGHPRIRVLGKGAKHRTVPLHEATLAAVTSYLSERSEQVGPAGGDDVLFVRHDGTAFTARSMRRLVERWYQRAGVRRHPGAAVHALRHTFATTALDSGASVVEVQQLLGHSSLDTTRNYLAVVGAGLEEAIRHHPMARSVSARHDSST